jgi:hypothetical protein
MTPRPTWWWLLTVRPAVLPLAALVLMTALVGCWARFSPSLPADLPIIEAPADLPADASVVDHDQTIAALTGLLAKAQAERNSAIAREREGELRAWRTWTRWIAAITVTLAVAGAGLSLWFGVGKLGVPVAVIAVASVLTLQAWAEFQEYLPYLFLVVLVVGLAIGVVALLRRDRAVVAGAKLTDLIEAGGDLQTVTQAKIRAHAAQLTAGIHATVQRARGKSAKPPARSAGGAHGTA